ncbi:hypothetical protein T492DRAFT_1095869 [Pavlovales sp. CCMP2436]|nr:hypothetical protein T492DRAFT_1095869 [Pavlovales sp. CCMP2436]
MPELLSVNYAVVAEFGSWDKALTGLASRLGTLGVRRGQLVGVYAHKANASAYSEDVLTAFYSLALPGRGALSLRMAAEQSNTLSWAQLHQRAAHTVASLADRSELVAVNAVGGGVSAAVLVITDTDLPADLTVPVRKVRVLHASGGSFAEATLQLEASLVSLGVRRGQVLSVDAHLEAAGAVVHQEAAVVSALYSPDLPGCGEVRLRLSSLSAARGKGWAQLDALTADGFAALELGTIADLLGMSAAHAPEGKAEIPVWYYAPADPACAPAPPAGGQ